jgi:hypothetical protein
MKDSLVYQNNLLKDHFYFIDNSTFNLRRFAYHQDNKLNGHSVQYHIDKNDPSSEADEEEFSASYIKRSELNRVHLKTPKI